MFATIDDAYSHFCSLHGSDHPIRSEAALREAIHEYGLRYEELDERFWNTLFESGWATGMTDMLPPWLFEADD